MSNLLKAYQADIKTLTWMSPATRDKALEKINQFTPKIGYPVHWRDYSAYDVSATIWWATFSAARFLNGTVNSTASTSRWIAPNGA